MLRPDPAYSTYLRQLHFARISEPKGNYPYSKEDEKVLLEILNSLPQSAHSSIQPILPLIYRKANQSGLYAQLQPKAQTFLKTNTLRLIAADLNNRQWLLTHLKVFQRENIPIILLKGVAFAGSVYPENAPRLGVDLDFLVRRNDFQAACTLLSETMNPVLLDSRRVATHDTLFERVFLPQNGTSPTVECHKDLTNPSIFNIDQQSLWAASRRHPAFNSDLVRMLSPEDTLLHLAVHAFRDLDFCTHNILDAHEVWCQWQPDPATLEDCATRWGARNVLFYLLENCKILMETPVSEDLLNSLKPASVINGINKGILHSTTLYTTAHTSLNYRAIQLISQITFPDHMHRGIQFQLSYARTRLLDWVINLRSTRRES